MTRQVVVLLPLRGRNIRKKVDREAIYKIAGEALEKHQGATRFTNTPAPYNSYEPITMEYMGFKSLSDWSVTHRRKWGRLPYDGIIGLFGEDVFNDLREEEAVEKTLGRFYFCQGSFANHVAIVVLCHW